MNRITMIRRLKAGYDPIIVSIEKWQNIKENNEVYKGADNCALCYVSEDDECKDCVLYKIGDCCDDTESSFDRAVSEDDPQIMIDALLKAKKWQRKQDCKDEKQKTKPKAEKKQTYHIGQRFKFKEDDEDYMIARCNCNTVVLTSLERGTRWSDTVKCKDDCQITESELDKLFGLYDINDFELITKEVKNE